MSDHKPQVRLSPIATVLLAAAGIHLLMLYYDFTHADVFLNADRATARWKAAQGLYAATAKGHTLEYLSAHGIPGDYVVQALVMSWLGKAGLIFFQALLSILAGFGVYRTGRLLGSSIKVSTIAAILYLALPQSLIFAHQLISEAIFSPLLAVSIWLTAEALVRQPKRGAIEIFLAAALLSGLATLVRPITLLWPIFAALIIVRIIGPIKSTIYMAAAFLPVLAWMGFMSMHTGEFGLGDSDHDMGHNLYQRVVRINGTLPAEQQQAVRSGFLKQGDDGSIRTMDYLRFDMAYPLPFIKQSIRDLFVMIGKSGVERLTIDYFEMNKQSRADLQNDSDDTGWRVKWERQGPLAAIRYLWATQGTVLIISLISSLLVVIMMLLAVTGGWSLVHDNPAKTSGSRHAIAWLLAGLSIYILVFSQVITAVQSRHRSPAESSLVLLAVIGGARLIDRRIGRNQT